MDMRVFEAIADQVNSKEFTKDRDSFFSNNIYPQVLKSEHQ